MRRFAKQKAKKALTREVSHDIFLVIFLYNDFNAD